MKKILFILIPLFLLVMHTARTYHHQHGKGYGAISVFTWFNQKKLIDLSIYHRCSINRVYRIHATRME